jgi:hypothetical protein
MIAHGTINAFIPVFPTIIMETDVFQTRFWFHEFLFLIVGAIFLASWVKKNRKNLTWHWQNQRGLNNILPNKQEF